ncbi:MAG: hypothetical protein R3B36_12230 [Polyangiaceae bacterium]
MKSTTSAGEQLKKELARRGRRRGPISPALRARGEDYARGRAADGAGYADIARELGVSETTAKRWSQAPHNTIVPVHVVDDSPAPRLEGLVVISARGLRIEGLDVDAVCTLLARHG